MTFSFKLFGSGLDALVSAHGDGLANLSKGASVGTSSVRRKAQLLGLRPDLRIMDLHGNVETRMRKMDEMGLEGIVLAAAGLDRLSLGERTVERFPVDKIVPAPGQGTIAVEIRRGDKEVGGLVSQISDEKTMLASECERAFASAIGGDCYVPAGANASVSGRSITLMGMIASPDGRKVLKNKMTSTDPIGLGKALGGELLRAGGAANIGGDSIRV